MVLCHVKTILPIGCFGPDKINEKQKITIDTGGRITVFLKKILIIHHPGGHKMIQKNWKLSFFCLILTGLFLGPILSFAGEPQGKKEISLYGGKSGNILFPHHLHQKVVTDCQTCHVDFAQREGALDAAKKSAALKKKQVMNKTCLKCHRALKKSGKTSGPTSCKHCHTKK